MAEIDFTGRSVLITGAASGIGKSVAEWLDQHGVGEIIAVDLDAEGLEALELTCQVRRIAGDVTDPELWAGIEDQLDRLDHAHINAGVANGGALTELEFAEWRRIMSVNLDGVFLGLRTALRIMKKHESGKSIVLTSSVVGVKPTPMTAAYGTSKAGVAHLAQIAAAEHLDDGIRINAVAPGRVDTPIWTKTDQFRLLADRLGHDKALRVAGEQAGGDHAFARPEELSGQIGFLLSDAAANITGTVLVADSGYSL
ncbi:MAG: SDR family NAD(P)-dependent oxidoreductase [Novosphingobium sp.]|nr:SDR family NAD(P)-dependent oxidoreductase [Novosphingobium sp.]